MRKSTLLKQLLIIFFGLPGSGKTFFSRQASEMLNMPVISSDRIRYELFEKPTYSKEENQVVMNMMNIMLDEYIKAGLSVIYDISLNRAQDRKLMKDLDKKHKLSTMLIWLQADNETCFGRVKSRNPQKIDDQYSPSMSQTTFNNIEKQMQLPVGEDAVVISGKHLFNSQKNVFLRKLSELQAIAETDPNFHVPMPGLVNLVSGAQAGRVDPNRRNVNIS